MKFYINGEEKFVYVDDYVPTRNGQPIYASSTNPGTIWPMIAEKAWAKLYGSYANSEGGNTKTVMSYL